MATVKKTCANCGDMACYCRGCSKEKPGCTHMTPRCLDGCKHWKLKQERRIAAKSRFVRRLLLDAALCLDDCLIRIYPDEYKPADIEAVAKRFYAAGGTISRIGNMVAALLKAAGKGAK